MSRTHPHVGIRVRKLARTGAAIAGVITLLAVIGLASAPGASAVSWETVKTFAPLVPPSEPNPPTWPEDVQLGGVGGMAVNRSGAGGVTPGTIYGVGSSNTTPLHVARFSPDGEFELAWNRNNVRCGPKAVPATTCPTFPIGNSGGVDVAVDQTTGNVYVLDIGNTPFVVREYKADGTGPIAEFGEFDPSGTATTSPGKVHGSPANEGIAVDDAGTVYVLDEATLSNLFHRLMVFKPQTPGDYEHYVYAGQSNDIGAGFLPSNPPLRPTVDDAGNVYVSGETYIEMYSPAQPSSPICTFKLPSGGIKSATVDPSTGRVFYFTVKDAKIHQLNPCNAEGKFVEEKTTNPPFNAIPQRGNIEALTFDPGRQFAPDRPPGVLYAGAPQECPGSGVCPPDAEGKSSQGYMFAMPISLLPIVVSESATQVGPTSATLNAQVNPRGSATSYVFQYLSEAAYQGNDPSDRFAGASQAPLVGAFLGTGQQPLLAAVTVAGLAPATTYRYRVVATSSQGTAVGTDALFRTRVPEGEGLPDGRAYELVSPAQKSGGEVLPGAPNTASCGSECKPGLAAKRYPVEVAPSGDAVGFQGQPFLENEGSPEYDEYISTRSASGWHTLSMSPPLIGGASGVEFEAFALSGGLTRGLTWATNALLTPTAPPGYKNIFSQPTDNRFDLRPLLTTTPPSRPPNGKEALDLTYAGATSDLSQVYFEANDALTGGSGSEPPAVDGGPESFNLYEWRGGQLHLVNVLPGNTETEPGASFGSGLQLANPSLPAADFSHAISDDGSRVFWSSESGQVYAREHGNLTREIPGGGKFLTAAADGSKVLLSNGVLYNLVTGDLTDLTEGSGGFQGIVGQSNDLSSIYFVATSVLSAVANDQGATAQSGASNLYLWRGGAISFVGTLLPDDNVELGLWRAAPVQRAAEASPDGRWLAFNSKAALTGANTIGACQFSPTLQRYVGAVPCEEVYLYDSQTGRLTCPSCSQTGSNPLGGSFLRILMNSPGSLAQPRYLTNDGRLFFDSRDALSTRDTNSGVEDLYQYEPVGIGSCTIPGGCISLISSGRGSYDSNFLAADASGNNVFFTTREQLVPRDQDQLIDLYDARVGGGLAVDYPAPQSPCVGEGCQGPPPAVQSEPSPNSSTFQGPGNLKPKKQKKKHHKKHHKKKKQKKKQHGKRHKSGGGKSRGNQAAHGRGGSK